MVKEKKTAQLQCKIISRRKHIGRAILLFTVILYVVADFDQLGLDPVRDISYLPRRDDAANAGGFLKRENIL